MIRLAFWIADTPEKAKLMMTHGKSCNVCLCTDEDWDKVGMQSELRHVVDAQLTWERAATKYSQEMKENAGELLAGNVMKEMLLKFCKVEPILHNLPDFDFQNQAYDEMHSLEGKLCACLHLLTVLTLILLASMAFDTI